MSSHSNAKHAAFQVLPLDGNPSFGAQVLGLTAASLTDDEVRRDLCHLWVQKGVLVFRGVSGADFQIELSKCFGEIMEHVTAEARSARRELATARYLPDDGLIWEVDGELLAGWLPWHTDTFYKPSINRGGILRPIVPTSGQGQTGFIDKLAAYEALPERLKKRIEGLYVILHPMVFTHKDLGQKVFNVSPASALGIKGLETEEGDALLREVIKYGVDEKRAYYHAWRLDDMVLWDNWRVLHCFTGGPPDEERWLERTTIAGDYGGGRLDA